MRIIPLSEGAFSIDQTKVFIPFNKTTDDLQARATGSLLVEVQPFVVITSEDILLLDTGLGFSDANAVPQLHKNLMDNGINPSEVTKVLMTHLHKDHAGGVSMQINGSWQLSFPNATYYVQKAEMEYALSQGLPSYIPEEITPLQTAPNVKWLEGNGVIDGYIKYEITGGHAPLHQVFTIVDGGETIFFGGDEAPQIGQMKKRYIAKYDFDGKRAMELRQQWWDQGQKENWSFLFYHDTRTPLFTP